MEIQVNHKSYSMARCNDESNDALAKRIWFIIKKDPKTETGMERAMESEQVYYNMTTLGCHYHPRTEKNVM